MPDTPIQGNPASALFDEEAGTISPLVYSDQGIHETGTGPHLRAVVAVHRSRETYSQDRGLPLHVHGGGSRRCRSAKGRALPRYGVELAEHAFLHAHFVEGGLDDQVGVIGKYKAPMQIEARKYVSIR